MGDRRAILESLKFLTAKEVLLIGGMCHSWNDACESEEIWSELLGSEGRAYREDMLPLPSLKDTYRLCHAKVCYAIRKTTLCKYTVSTDSWVTTPLQVQSPFTAATILYPLTPNQLFVLPDISVQTLLITISTGHVQSLPNRKRTRDFPGVCLYFGNVYVFCGHLRNQNDKFTLSTRTWHELPDSHEDRQAFNPAIYQRKIYLPNGCTGSVELFNPENKTFTLLPFQSKLVNSAASVVVDKKLMILGMTGYCVVDLMVGTQEEGKYDTELPTAWSVYPPVLAGQELVLVWPYYNHWKMVLVNVNNFQTREVKVPEEE